MQPISYIKLIKKGIEGKKGCRKRISEGISIIRDRIDVLCMTSYDERSHVRSHALASLQAICHPGENNASGKVDDITLCVVGAFGLLLESQNIQSTYDFRRLETWIYSYLAARNEQERDRILELGFGNLNHPAQ